MGVFRFMRVKDLAFQDREGGSGSNAWLQVSIMCGEIPRDLIHKEVIAKSGLR
jgi:hypothetical protein